MKQRDKWEDYLLIKIKELAFEGTIGQHNVAQDSIH
jgi:hypothetical protein